ncbi:TonB-dependent receptor [Aureibaculum sp. A20]|uniref:TonB-dependent receptor n=1 Tax=Aureibaculum flavum TaxID=2795986 RepID=A0ABS0WSH2_9FLAO|nr:TonB-dependent receptor [Aureibaculum flavum]MBJ2174931.1 TonB-dependent receptor [Aureibaculum flavum]
MRKLIAITLFMVSLNFLNAQQNQDLISIDFNDISRTDAMHQLEEKFNYQFYFVKEWFSQEKININFKNVTISKVLNQIFEDTNFNYFILKNKGIVITQNRVIYSDLPDNFFGNKKVIDKNNRIETESARPVFKNKIVSSNKTRTETVSIGKENPLDKRTKYKLSGYIRDSKTGMPWSNVSIVVKNTVLGVETDKNGYYQITIPRGYNTIETSSIGLGKTQKNVIIYNDGTLNINLSENIEELDEIIVSSKQTSNVVDSEIGTNEVDSEKSKNIPLVMGERNMLKVATALPGITTAGEGSSGFNVRGGKTDQNLILLDNAVLYNPAHFFGIFQALNPFTTKNIKIYKGSVPAQFGGRLSSVFDITTKDGSLDKFKGEASIGPVTGNIALEIPIIKEKASLVLGGRSTYSNWILNSLDNKSLKNSKASFYDLIGKFNAKIDSTNEVRATAYYSNDDFSITSDSVYGYNNLLLSVLWNKKFNDKNSSSLSISKSQYKFNINYDGQSNDNFGYDYGIDEIGAKLRLVYLHSDKHKFNYGVSVKKYEVNPGKKEPLGENSAVIPLNLENEYGLESAVFLEDGYKINNKFLINVGLRYSMFQALGSSLTRVYETGQPRNNETVSDTLNFGKNKTIKNYGGLETRLSGRYLLNKDFSIKLGYNSAYQYLHTLSNNTTLSPIDTWKLSDYHIKPQKSQQLSLGLFKNINGNDYELSLEGYYKKSENVPDFKTGAQLLLNENVETEILQGKGKAYGIEFLVKKNKGKLSGWFAYTYSKSLIKLDSPFKEEQINNGNYFPSNYDKPHNLNIVSNFKVTRRFSFSANFEYQTGRPVTYPIGNFDYQGDTYVIYSERNKFRIPDYYRLDLSFNIEGNHKLKKLGHSYWNISVYNVLGRNNPYSVFFVTENGNVKAYKSSIFSVPIPTISYNIKF